MVKAVAARVPRPRDRRVESNPTKGGRPSQKKRLALLEASAALDSASQKGCHRLPRYTTITSREKRTKANAQDPSTAQEDEAISN